MVPLRYDSSLILLFALTNAVLYSCLLPLWEGFDEPAHYSYVQYLSAGRGFPVVNRTSVSEEIRESLRLVPVSWILHNALPGSISFENWFHLSPDERRSRRSAVSQLSPGLRTQPSDLLNYEAQQAPLAYVTLAPFDAALSRMQLPRRVLFLRLIVATCSELLLFYAANLLLHLLGVEGGFRVAALACIFESQMLWASVAHVGNDWLAIPLGTLFVALLVLTVRNSQTKYVLVLAGVLAAGLLTKAYFLAFVPVFMAVLVAQLWGRRLAWPAVLLATCILLVAAPWYARNIILYQSLSGTQESVTGIGPGRALEAFFHINWFTSTLDLLRWSVWTGNWSFVSFSRLTLNIALLLMAAAGVLFLAGFRKITAAEWWIVTACIVFFLGLVYQTCVTWVATHGESRHAEPWYLQCIFPCIWIVAFLGLQRSGRLGRVIAALIVPVTFWIAAATYFVKLIPLYGGFEGRSTLPAIFHWWRYIPLEALASTILGPLPVLAVVWSLFVILLVALNVQIFTRLSSSRATVI